MVPSRPPIRERGVESGTLMPMTKLKKPSLLCPGVQHDTCEESSMNNIEVGLWTYKKRPRGPRWRPASF